MLKRKITDKLIKWKNSENKKSLVIQGARQVGKTFAVKAFGEVNYAEIVEINFKETPSATEIFAGDLNVESLLLALRFRYPDKKMVPGETLFFFDEIQECPEAITSLKFWTIDNRYDVIVSGSLLGIDYKRPSSYPVGYVEYVKLFGMDFEEFLWACGIDDTMVDTLHGYFYQKQTVPEAINNRMMGLLREYLSIGGMPEVVAKYIESRDFAQVVGDGHIDLKITRYALDKLNIDKRGLDSTDNRILRTIITSFKGGPVGANTIATAIGEDQGTYEEVYEPFLIKEGFIVRTQRGRVATELSYQHLGLEKFIDSNQIRKAITGEDDNTLF